jgi:bifunctional DNA-binding transcriptional regulator/antitoxin component of YhaV-PrlF toxin-antitoxin module
MDSLIVRKSKVSRFKRDSRSVKTTIPLNVAEILKIGPGDTLIWEVRLEKEKRFAVVNRAPPE